MIKKSLKAINKSIDAELKKEEINEKNKYLKKKLK